MQLTAANLVPRAARLGAALAIALAPAFVSSCSAPDPPARSDECAHLLRRVPSLPASKGAAQTLDLGAIGYCRDDDVKVRFTAEGRAVELEPIAVEPLSVGVPIWLHPDGRVGDVDVEVVVVGPDATHGFGVLHIDPLPRSDLPPGTVSLSVLDTARTALAGARRHTTLFVRGEVIDAELASMDSALQVLMRAIEDVQSGTVTPPVVGRAGNRPAVLDTQALEILDGIFLSWLRSHGQTAPALAGRSLRPLETMGDGDWFHDLMTDVTSGSLETIREFAGYGQTVLAALALLAAIGGSTPAAVPLAALSAILYATTTFVPAATSFVVGLGARTVSATDPLDPAVWTAVQPPVRHIFQQTLSFHAPTPVAALLEDTTPVGAAAGELLDAIANPTDGAMSRVVDRIVGSCPGGAIPKEIGFNPDYTLCPDEPHKPADPPPPITTYEYCRDVEGGGFAIYQCEEHPGSFQVQCDDGSRPPGCVESEGYRMNGGILCCPFGVGR